uniref:Amino acid transporter transmembrane domain-containing protein n=1 Tax=Heliothis virescens TaxID=7102 RepID=A0A2A4K5U8_HELVI
MTPAKDNQNQRSSPQRTGSQRAAESRSGPSDASTSANANPARLASTRSTDQASTSGRQTRNNQTSPNQPPDQASASIRVYSESDIPRPREPETSEIEMFIGSTARALAAPTPTASYTYSSGTRGDLPSNANRPYRNLANITPDHELIIEPGRSHTPSLYTLERELRNYTHKRDSTGYDYYPGTERAVYDYIEERNDMYNTNLVESTAHLIKGSLGAGVLSMHEAYMYGGLWTSLAVTIAIGITISYTMLMLVRSAQKVYRRLRISKLSYPDLAEAACATSPWHFIRRISKPFRYFVDACIVMEMCGTCCIYQIMIGYSISKMFEGMGYVSAGWLMSIRFYILISAPILLPLCQIRSLKFLAPFSMLADLFVAVCVLATLYYSVITLNSNILDRHAWKNIHGFFRIAGICMYSTSGICVALPVENNMKRPRHFPQAVRFASIVVLSLTVTTGLFGYWAWGENCRSPITVHMPLNVFTTVLQFLMIMMLSISFAVQFWVPFRILWHYIAVRYKRKHALLERVHRLVMALIVMAFTMLFPNVISVMIFLGQFLMGLVALVFPAFIEFLVDWEEAYTHRFRVRFCQHVKNLTLATIGLTLSASTLYSKQQSTRLRGTKAIRHKRGTLAMKVQTKLKSNMAAPTIDTTLR